MATPNTPVSTDDRGMAALAHASGILNLFTGMGGLIGAALIWLIQRDKSPWTAYHALQSLVFQALVGAAAGVIIGVTWLAGFMISFITFGFGALIAVPLMILTMFLGMGLVFTATAYQVYAAVQVNNGMEFTYIWVGNWVRRQMKLA